MLAKIGHASRKTREDQGNIPPCMPKFVRLIGSYTSLIPACSLHTKADVSTAYETSIRRDDCTLFLVSRWENDDFDMRKSLIVSYPGTDKLKHELR
jgi:hypothetical protein